MNFQNIIEVIRTNDPDAFGGELTSAVDWDQKNDVRYSLHSIGDRKS